MVEEDDQADGAVGSSANANSVGAGGARKGGDGAGAGGAAAAGRDKKQEEEAVVEEEEEEEEVLEEPDEEALGKMSSMEQRLFKIRLKMNKVCCVCVCVASVRLGWF